MRIANWDKWQTYRKDRGTPPWIKVHRSLMTHPEWVRLTDSQKGHVVSLWILAASDGGQIPDDPKLLQKMAMLDDPPDTALLLSLGFLTNDGCQDDAAVTTSGPQSVHLDTDTDTEGEVDTDLFGHFWAIYPRKIKKKNAEKAWSRITKCNQQKIIADVQNRASSDPQWLKKNGEFIPYPATYLNGEQWTDDWEPDPNRGQWSETTQRNITILQGVNLQ